MSYQYCDGISQMEPSIEQFKMFEVHKIQMGSELATNRISWKFHSNDILEVSIQRRELIKKFHSERNSENPQMREEIFKK